MTRAFAIRFTLALALAGACTTRQDVLVGPTCLSPMPGACTTPSAPITQLALGLRHACLATTAGVSCWGSNLNGQLAACLTTSLLEVPFAELTLDATQLALGEQHTCALEASHALACWGQSADGQTGVGVGSSSPTPTTLAGSWSSVSSRRFHTCGVKTDGTLWCWGRNDLGQLGVGDTTSRSVPTQVDAGSTRTWSRVVVGGSTTCALDSTGATWCWGQNDQGEVGNGTTTTQTTPVQVAIVGPTTFTELALGKEHSCGLDGSGKIWCWGRGMEGQLGNLMTGAAASQSTPVVVTSATTATMTWRALAAGWFHTCAIDSAGALYCWGDNTQQALAATATSFYSKPLLIDAGPWSAVAAGYGFTCVRDAAGTKLSCFGVNDAGQLGVGDLTTHTPPTAVCW